jgi:hypothetical protein
MPRTTQQAATASRAAVASSAPVITCRRASHRHGTASTDPPWARQQLRASSLKPLITCPDRVMEPDRGGPTIRAATVLKVSPSELFNPMVPGMVLGMATVLVRAERRRRRDAAPRRGAQTHDRARKLRNTRSLVGAENRATPMTRASPPVGLAVTAPVRPARRRRHPCGDGRGFGREEHGAARRRPAWHTRRPHLDHTKILAVSRETAPSARARRPAPPAAPAAERGTDASPSGARAKDACTSRTHQTRAQSSAEPGGLPSPGSRPVPVRKIGTARRGQEDCRGVARPLAIEDVEHMSAADQACVQHLPA